ncbi:MAG: prepilin-type N-terminal cleavage/methylation domain-containing protein [Colwellia sp.]|nr:prepilin-type N-terminal cleavage/methylation domain-containing protein [Colwellia sp.]
MKNKGFTLIELLITMAIMAMVMSVASYNYSQYSRYWHTKLGSYEQRQAQMRSKLQLRDSLNAMAPYIVKNSSGNWVYYFLGRDEGLTFVTYAPIFAQQGGTAVVRIFKEPQGEGSYRLVYEEAPLTSIMLTQANQILNFQYRLVIANDLPDVVFEYYGWPDRNSKYNIEGRVTTSASWSSEYDGTKTSLQPDKIKITSDFVNFNLAVSPGDEKLLGLFLPGDF